MIEFFKNSAIAVVISAIGAVGGYFQGAAAQKEVGAAKIEEVRGEVRLVGAKNAEQDKELLRLEQAVVKQGDMIGNLDKKLDRLLWINGVNPKEVTGEIKAEVPPNAPLITGVNPDGSPKNADGSSGTLKTLNAQ